MIFSSVTTAALAAVEMQQELRAIQSGKGDDERLSIRISISLGDVLHQDRDIFLKKYMKNSTYNEMEFPATFNKGRS
ncbi:MULTISPECIES: hypothetical protein [Oscillatoriales]|uniref:hypothetical protein n=1 Tax=Oscillatoriophycideae TaxID=1301283 RepID=UPI001F557060|nr:MULTISPECIES: hypothetical protein [Oscillatoriales]